MDSWIWKSVSKSGFSLSRRFTTVGTIFWPGLALFHYTKDVLERYKANDVDFVQKDLNSPNPLELRSIEKYWAIMKEHLLK